MNYQWYPGHMTKARRMMQEDIKLIDLIIELVDARIPLSSRNPDIDQLGQGKGRMVLLNKSDLADPKGNQSWMEYFSTLGITAVEVNSKTKAGIKGIQRAVEEACKEKRERDQKRGILNRPVRAMVVGIPNVGKSTFINAYAGRACTKTGNKPGVTKGKQWIRLGKGLELLDTPGILWPKFEDQQVGMRLAFIGSINDEILIEEELATDFLLYIKDRYPEAIEGRYGFCQKESPSDTLEEIARIRGCYKKGQVLDITKAAAILMDDFRSGRLGRMTLEEP
ncbi:MAG: ribosome biogenesis GTPase YlqF [Lachnospiraceae bacterium]|nr:ribosome biogenesis GTPase YlqF [Lachnospiraceae bacterium]MCI7595521.1 ribosome biogenesis GTPase YlqF [Lachnospiraceae bacterium]MDY3222904.1 ribosome biogenesis GTPase YlqF [Lachnospiraceae bacterium]